MQGEKYHLTVNDKFEYDLTASSLSETDIVPLSDGHFHILKNGKSYRAEMIALDFASKSCQLKINGSSFQVSVADHFDQLVKKMGLSSTATHKINVIKAPMPGLVLSIAAEPGQEIVRGDTLLILEAMKMENVIKSPGEGKVKKVLVSKGKAVDKGEVLIEME